MMIVDSKIKKTIYIFGNSLLSFDSLPIKLVPKLQKIFPEINFVIKDPNENLWPEKGELILIDTVVGIDRARIIEDIDSLQTEKIYSAHDFDLGFNLKLLWKIGKLKKLKILGVPVKISSDLALEQLKELIKKTT